MSMSIKHIPVQTWLSTIGLGEYRDVFQKHAGIESLLYVKEGELRDMGVKNGAHRARMISSLGILKDKYEGKLPSSPRHSGSFSSPSPPSYVGHPDYALANVSAEQLKADLEKELRMDSNDIRSHAWYHGALSRQKAERLVQSNGDFLVRESLSQPGDYVLTCFCKGVPLHFVINKTVQQTIKYTTLMYQLEADSFNTIPDLIRFYIGNRRTVTAASGAVISTPVNRTIPLSYQQKNNEPTSGLQRRMSANYVPVHSPMFNKGSPHGSPFSSPAGSPQLEKRTMVHRRTGSQPILSMDDETVVPAHSIGRHGSLPSIELHGDGSQNMKPVTQTQHLHYRTGSEPLLDTNNSPMSQQSSFSSATAITGSEGNLSQAPPPKPSRVPTIKRTQRPKVQIRNKALYDDDGADYSDYDQVKESPKSREFYRDEMIYDNSPQNNRQRSAQSSLKEGPYDNNFNAKFTVGNDYDKPHSNESVTGLKQKSSSKENILLRDDSGYGSIKTKDNLTMKEYVEKSRKRTISIPSNKQESCHEPQFNPFTFYSSILPPENKPLDSSALLTVKSVLQGKSANFIAKCITKVDLELIRATGDHDLGVGIHSGLELMSLPQGQQLRKDILERYNCLKQFVVLTILSCQKPAERASMLVNWIEVASEMRGTMGNLYSFSAVMDAIGSVQITRLKATWQLLRQSFTKTALLFDSKLKNLMKSLNEGTGSLPLQNISIPYILPLVQLLERESHEELTHWEKSDVDFGIDIMLAHLDTARIFSEQCGLYRIKGEEIIKNFKVEEATMDIFQTEFHLNLLWGARGAGVAAKDRYNKFIQLLNALSQRVEPPNMDIGTAL